MDSPLHASREPEDVIISRNGSVLGKKTILKSDHFPGCQNKRLLPHIEGAPNYRQVGELPVYGVAIPTVDGIRNVLNMVGASNHGKGRRVLWHNMREEPVIYINGRPFVLREIERPFNNLEYTGIDRARVEQMETRLKEDVLKEAKKYGNKIMVSDELPDGQMIDQWEPIGPDSVQTSLEVYQNLQELGYEVDYERIPVTDEKSPKERDFDLLIEKLVHVDFEVAQLYNCQMGRGRTTTAMVVATLICLRRKLTYNEAISTVSLWKEKNNISVPYSDESLKKGEYDVIRSLTRVLQGGIGSKRLVDSVIDQCSAMQNLREAIFGYRNSIQKQTDEKKRQASLSNFVEYLERYYFLICFADYIHMDEHAMHGKGEGFRIWMKKRPELYSVLRRMLRRDPMRALGFSSNLNQRIGRSIPSLSPPSHRTSDDEYSIVSMRVGQVLGKQTVLKSDHCPGCQNFNLHEIIEGAPNFRKIANLPIYGVANPTVSGIQRVLTHVYSDTFDSSITSVMWHNMREEPTVYINGNPFVLREVERPFKNMLEYTGIDRARVEQMESRLKEDVCREAERYGGSIMVNHESEEGDIYDTWEKIDSVSSVLTPLEVYESLRKEGYNVDYFRLPITDGMAPKSRDFDSLTVNISNSDNHTAYVFNCQMGRGRTTTGTVIASLVYSRCSFGKISQLDQPTTLKRSKSKSKPNSPLKKSMPMSSSPSQHSPSHGSSSSLRSPSTLPTNSNSQIVDACKEKNALNDIETNNIIRNTGVKHSSPLPAKSSQSQTQPISMIRQTQSQSQTYSGSFRSVFGSRNGLNIMNETYDGKDANAMMLKKGESSSEEEKDDSEEEEEGEESKEELKEESFVNAHSEEKGLKRLSLGREGINGKETKGYKDKDEGEREGWSEEDREGEGEGYMGEGESPSPNGMRKRNVMKEGMEDIVIVRKITRLLEGGGECRQFLDDIIDECAMMQNIRKAILRYRHAFNHQDEDARVRQSALSRGIEYLERYYMLIIFTAYLNSESFIPGPAWRQNYNSGQNIGYNSTENSLPFKQWIKRRPEIRQMKWSMRLRPARVFSFPEVEFLSYHEEDDENNNQVMDAIIQSRSGSVLGKKTILKKYLFPNSIVNASEGMNIPGVPNIFKVEGFPIHSTATPTVEGAKKFLNEIHAHSSSPMPRLAIITDLREEAVVYIHGHAFLLREMDHPMATMKNVGIEGHVLEQMERRLKEDILSEAKQGGRVLLHKESIEPNPLTCQSDVIGFWQKIEDGDVLTPADVYACMKKEGYCVDYNRIPLTRERTPTANDVDSIQRQMDNAPINAEYIFVSNSGYGGVAYAMSITCLRMIANLQTSSSSPLLPPIHTKKPSPPSPLSPSCPPSTRPQSSALSHSIQTYSQSSLSPHSSPKSPSPSILPSPFSPSSPLTPSFHVGTPPSPRTVVRGVYDSRMQDASFPPSPLTSAFDTVTSSSSPSSSSPSAKTNWFNENERTLRNGDYRDIMNLERVLVNGPRSRCEVNAILDKLLPAGRLREDIYDYKTKANACDAEEEKINLNDMAMKSLRRYYLLIIFRAYLFSKMAEKNSTFAGKSAFVDWMMDRPELEHACNRLRLI